MTKSSTTNSVSQTETTDVPRKVLVRDPRLALVAFVATLLLGLASRRFPGLFPALFGKYPGDVLWAMMVFFGLGTLRPQATTRQVALMALFASAGIEFLKLYQAPWAVTLRHTTLGHLIFGHVFSWANLFAYAVGIGIAAGLDRFLYPAQKS